MSTADAATPAERRICVTGASGYVGTHIVRELLERGYLVRGTVRSLRDPAKTAHLRGLAAGLEASERLELVEAQLDNAASLEAAMQNCWGLCHVASAAQLKAKDPQREIVDVAVDGTRNALEAASRAGVSRVVLTSSVAAVIDERKAIDHPHSESDWNEERDVQRTPYTVSKALAERAAWKLHAELPPERRFSLVAINPSVILGPVYAEVHTRSTPAVLLDLLRGKMPGMPKLYFSVVDVRDVATAHVNALEREALEGRFILYNQGMWMREMAELLRRRWPTRPIPKRGLPNWLVYASALVDPRINFAFLRRNLDVIRTLDNTRSRELLGIEYRPVAETIEDSATSFIELGLA